jgi:uncharacterized membrane protein (DUF485 family)
MPHFDGPPSAAAPEEASAVRWRLGLVLFFCYLACYTGFVLLNAFAPNWMEVTPFAGVNLAILYGLALIVFAFVLAVAYDLLCSAFGSRQSAIGQNQSGSGQPTADSRMPRAEESSDDL